MEISLEEKTMDGFTLKVMAAKVNPDKKFYDRVARFGRGERNCFSKDEIEKLKTAGKVQLKLWLKALDECKPND